MPRPTAGRKILDLITGLPLRLFARSLHPLRFKSNPSPDPNPRTGNPALSARGTTTRRMQRRALEDEVASLALRGRHDHPFSTGTNTSLDVMEILLEDLDRQTELMPEIVKLPLALGQPFDDFLAARRHERPGQGLSAFSASHW
jgi:hypothetical protein